jgi:hypothetical protein
MGDGSIEIDRKAPRHLAIGELAWRGVSRLPVMT